MNAKDLIIKLEKEKNRFKIIRAKLDDSLDNQVEYVKDLIEQYRPVFEWYHENNLPFTHPKFNASTTAGPILGLDKQENELIIYNINHGYIEKVYLDDNDQRNHFSVRSIVEEGYFQDAVAGLKYLDNMLGNYNEENLKIANRLRNELESHLEEGEKPPIGG